MSPDVATEAPKPGPGRPKGYPRTGGRARGTPNKATQLGRDFIIRRGAPIEVLCKIARGEKIQAAADAGSASKRQGVFPSIDQRLAAARILAAKLVPDLKAVEASGPGGGPMVLTLVDFLRQLPE